MTESESIKICNTIVFATSFSNPQGIPLNTTKEELTEAIRMSIQALEKQITMKPYHISQVDDNDNANVECPMCHATADYAVNVIKRGYCWKCGQLLDWSDEE